jgi:hypothetical protein
VLRISADNLLCEQVDKEYRYDIISRGSVCLRAAEVKAAAHFCQRLADEESAMQEVAPIYPQGSRLAPTEATIGKCVCERPIVAGA